MKALKVSTEFGILIRRESLKQRNILFDELIKTMADAALIESNEHLISFGPSFGEDALITYIRRLESLGLIYSDDFFDLRMDHPSWCTFQASLT